MGTNSHFYKELNRDVVFLIIGLMFSVSCIVYFLFTPAIPTEKVCGKVLSHSTQYVTTKKNNKEPDYYLNVDFGSKYYKPIKVSEIEYLKIADDSKYCCDMPVEASVFHNLFYLLGFVFFIGALILILLNVLNLF